MASLCPPFLSFPGSTCFVRALSHIMRLELETERTMKPRQPPRHKQQSPRPSGPQWKWYIFQHNALLLPLAIPCASRSKKSCVLFNDRSSGHVRLARSQNQMVSHVSQLMIPRRDGFKKTVGELFCGLAGLHRSRLIIQGLFFFLYEDRHRGYALQKLSLWR